MRILRIGSISITTRNFDKLSLSPLILFLKHLSILVAFFFATVLVHIFISHLVETYSALSHPAYLPKPSPFQSPHCLWEHVKFASGQALFRDRVAHTAECSPEVMNALVDLGSVTSSDAGNDCHGDPLKCPLEWIVYATSCSRGLNRLAKAVAGVNDIKLTILGMGVGWRGWGQRVRAYHDYLSQISPDAMVLLTDGDDVVLVPGCKGVDVFDGFVRAQGNALSPVLFEAVKYPWPDQEDGWRFRKENLVVRPKGVRDPRREGRRREGNSKDYTPIPPSVYKFLNAGAVIGKAHLLQALIRRIYKNDCIDDQRAFIESYLSPDMYWSNHPGSRSMVKEIESRMQGVSAAEQKHGVGSLQYLKMRERLHELAMMKVRVESAQFGGNQVSMADDVKWEVPAHARPLIGLDFENDLFLSMYDVAASALLWNNQTRRVEVKSTGGAPCILHQSGTKTTNRALEELSRLFGMDWDKKAIERSRVLQKQHPEQVRLWDT